MKKEGGEKKKSSTQEMDNVREGCRKTRTCLQNGKEMETMKIPKIVNRVAKYRRVKRAQMWQQSFSFKKFKS